MREMALVSVLFAFLAVSSIKAGEVDLACLAKVKSVGSAAWQEAASRMNNIEYTFHKQTKSLDSTHKIPATTLSSDWTVSLFLAEKRWLVDARHVEQGTDGVYVENPEYEFGVASEKNQQNDTFKLVEASRRKESGNQVSFGDKFKIVQESYGAAFNLLGLELNKMFSNPDYELVTAKFVGEGSSEERAIRLEWDSPSVKGQQTWAEVSPQTSWLIDRCGVKNPDGMELLREVTYQPYEQGLVPKTVKTTIKFPQFTETETLTIEPPHPCSRSEAEFYLPYYGISESVVQVTRTSSWVRIVAIVLSVLGVALSVYLYRSSRRSSGPKVTPA